jgi:Icc-related predicted phosphoesterase
MRLLALSDIHGNKQCVRRILAHAAQQPGKPEAIVIAGDLTNWGSPDEAIQIIELCEAYVPQVLTVSGNCDDELIEKYIVKHGNSLTGRGRVVNEVGFFGVSCGTPHLGNTWEVSEEVMAGWLQGGHREIADTPRKVLVTHSPPHGMVDFAWTKKHGGSHAVRAALDQYDIQLVLCGHIHEARGLMRYNHTTIINCGAAWMGFYATIELNDTADVVMWHLADNGEVTKKEFKG